MTKEERLLNRFNFAWVEARREEEQRVLRMFAELDQERREADVQQTGWFTVAAILSAIVGAIWMWGDRSPGAALFVSYPAGAMAFGVGAAASFATAFRAAGAGAAASSLLTRLQWVMLPPGHTLRWEHDRKGNRRPVIHDGILRKTDPWQGAKEGEALEPN